MHKYTHIRTYIQTYMHTHRHIQNGTRARMLSNMHVDIRTASAAANMHSHTTHMQHTLTHTHTYIQKRTRALMPRRVKCRCAVTSRGSQSIARTGMPCVHPTQTRALGRNTCRRIYFSKHSPALIRSNRYVYTHTYLFQYELALPRHPLWVCADVCTYLLHYK
jgi:hypothetical protein